MKFSARKIGWAFGSGIAVAVGALLCGCESASPSGGRPDGTAGNPPSMSTEGMGTITNPPTGSADILMPGNRIVITYSGHANVPLPHQEVIREDGTISPPLLGKPVMAGGKKVGDLHDELIKLYVPDYFKTLTIVVTCDERYFFVGGDVRMPKQYPYLSTMTVLKAIKAAGDFNEYADRTKVQITRANGRTEFVNCKKALKNPRLDLPIYPGDQIFVTRKWM